MADEQLPPSRSLALVRGLNRRLDEEQRAALYTWARRLLEIRASTASRADKARRAIATTRQARVIWPIVRTLAANLKDVAWGDRGWPARLALAAGGVTAVTAGGQGAGIAALGTAIGLPLWVVLGAGGAFAGMLVEELGRSRTTDADEPLVDAEEVIDADWELLKENSVLPPP